MIKSKKADLSLSTNAIVILILAITILGLGLTFVRGLFKQAESKITEVTSSTELVNPPTTDNPLTLTPSQITLRQKEKTKVTLAYLNNGPGKKDCGLFVLATTAPATTTEIGSASVMVDSKEIKNLVIYNTNKATIDQDKINVWTLAVDGSKVKSGTTQSTGTFVLSASMCCVKVGVSPTKECPATLDEQVQYTRDLIIKVTS